MNSQMKIKTYVINLKDSVDRREAVLAETAKYPFLDVELVEAVDGRKLNKEEVDNRFDSKKFVNRYYRTPRRGEIGCTLSHRVCYRKFLETEEKFALILEDDVNFIYPEDLEMLLTDVLTVFKDDKPYLITFALHFLYYPKKYRQLGKYTFFRINDAYGTCAYLINRNAANRMLAVSVPFTLADDFSFIRKRGIRVMGSYPTFAVGASTKAEITTEIQEEQVIRHKNSVMEYVKNIFNRIYCKVLLISGRMAIRLYVHGINQ